MLWFIEPTRTNWRINAGLVNTYFRIFVIDFGLTAAKDTTGGDSTVHHPCIDLWISQRPKSQHCQKVIHRL
jgi:hypothetical protein